MLARLLNAIWPPRDRSRSTRGVASDAERRLGRARMALAQAHANYQAAKRIWPRNRGAEKTAWHAYRGAKCAVLRAELGR